MRNLIVLAMALAISPNIADAADKISLRCDTIEECQAKVDKLKAAHSAKPPPVRMNIAQPEGMPMKVRTAKERTSSKPEIEAQVFLRKSMDDLGTWLNPGKLEKAAGAQFSFSQDNVTNNRNWSAQGLLGVRLLRWGAPETIPYISESMFALYTQFDREFNSKLTKNDVNDLTMGFSSEVAVPNIGGATWYMRANGEILTDFDGNVRSWDVRGELQPFGNLDRDGPNTIFSYMGTPLPLGPYFYLTVTPKLRAEYRGRLEGSDDPLFALHDRVLRAGPLLTVNIDGDTVFPEHTPWWAQRLHYQLVYGYLYDTLSSLSYNYLDTSLTFNLDKQGYLGLSFSYRKGKVEASGKDIDLAKVSLSAKYGG